MVVINPGGTIADRSILAGKLADTARGDGGVAWGPTDSGGRPAISETFSRINSVTTDSAILASGQLFLIAGGIAPEDRPLTAITLESGATAAVGLANQWFSIVRMSDLAVLAKTVDDGATAWGVNAPKTLLLSAQFTPTVDTPFYFGIVIVATTPPSLRSIQSNVNINDDPPIVAGQSTAGLTNPASLGPNAGALTAVAPIPYAFVS